MKPSYQIFLRTGSSCNAGCISCPAGRKTKEDVQPGGMMKPEMLDRIFEYVLKQGRITAVQYHYYNEPLMNPHIVELVRLGKVKYGVNGVLSTNLSVGFDRLLGVLETGLDKIMISVSGFTQAIHERSHAGVDIERLKGYMRQIAKIKRRETVIQVSWHRYDYNMHEESLMAALCYELGFRFVPYDTGVLPLERVLARWRDGKIDPAERDIRTKLREASKLCSERKFWPCINQQNIITVDSDGMLHACCVKNHAANMSGSLFDTNLKEFNRWRKEEDPRCGECKDVGLHVYAMQQYRTPINWKTNLSKRVETIWRELGMGGLFPRASRWWTNHTYERPFKK